MKPAHAQALVRRWVDLYTFGLPEVIAQRRRDEIAADVLDHIEHERATGTSEGSTAISIVSRMARGVRADVSWRRESAPPGGRNVKPLLAVVGAAFALAAFAFVADSVWLLLVSVALFGVFVLGVLAAGFKSAQQGNFVAPFVAILGGALAAAVVGVASIVVGQRGDAPGLVLLGTAVIVSAIVGAFVFGMRTAQGSS